MTKPRAVEHDHPIVLPRQINQAARLEILDHAADAVKQDQGPNLPVLYVMQTHAVDLNEVSLCGIVTVRLLSKLPVHERSCG